MNHVKLKLVGGILLIFFLGIAAGALGMHIYQKQRIERIVRGPAAFLFPRFMEKIGNDLGLTPEQRKKVGEILGDLEESLFAFREKHAGELDAIIDRHFQRLKAALSPEQQEKLEKFQHHFRKLKRRWLKPHNAFGPPRDSEARPFHGLLRQRLQLSEAAWDQVHPILRKDFQQKRRLFRRHWKEDLTEAEFQREMDAIRMETERELGAVLTPEQLSAYRQLREEFTAREMDDRPPPPDPRNDAP